MTDHPSGESLRARLIWESAAARSAADFVERYARECCRHTEAVSECPHCNMTFLAKWARKAADALRVSPVSTERLEAAKAVEAYAQWCGGVHDDGCPEDDTCECSGKWINDGVTKAVDLLRVSPVSEPIDNGNTYVFCDYVDEQRHGCVRGAGHNGPHAFCYPGATHFLGPVKLRQSSPAVPPATPEQESR